MGTNCHIPCTGGQQAVMFRVRGDNKPTCSVYVGTTSFYFPCTGGQQAVMFRVREDNKLFCPLYGGTTSCHVPCTARQQAVMFRVQGGQLTVMSPSCNKHKVLK